MLGFDENTTLHKDELLKYVLLRSESGIIIIYLFFFNIVFLLLAISFPFLENPIEQEFVNFFMFAFIKVLSPEELLDYLLDAFLM